MMSTDKDTAQFKRVFGAIVRRLREAKGWSQKEFAGRIKTTPAAVSGWELGKTDAATRHFLAVAKEFGLEPHELFTMINSEWRDEASEAPRRLAEPPASFEVPAPKYMQSYWRNARTFTAMVNCLIRLEHEAENDADAAVRRQAAWKLLIVIRPVIEQLAHWTREDWLALELRLKRSPDHWHRLTKKREESVIGPAIQGELPL
jgi:transcriptional regulator with XRE-family HTH domain